jgi:CHAT domain-containing protein/tetratricopeptide (TPR) repeat protein
LVGVWVLSTTGTASGATADAPAAPSITVVHSHASAATAAQQIDQADAVRKVRDALKQAWLPLDPNEQHFIAAKRALDEVRPLMPYVGDPHRFEYIRSVRSTEYALRIPFTDFKALFAEWAMLRQRGIGVEWAPPKFFDLDVRFNDIYMAGWHGRFDESRQSFKDLLVSVRRDAARGTDRDREQLRWFLGQVGGQRLWHEEVARFAEEVADDLGPNDELAVRALLSAAFTVRVMHDMPRATALAERGYRSAQNFPSPLREKLMVGASSQLGLCYASSGRLLEAKPLLEYARDEAYRLNDPSVLSRAWVWYSTAHLYSLLGEYDEAIREYYRAIDVVNERPVPPSDPDRYDLDRRVLWLWIAHTHALAGRESESIALFNRAMEHSHMWASYDPWVHSTYPVFARQLVRSGRAEEALRLLTLGRKASFNSAGPESADIATIDLGQASVLARGSGQVAAAQEAQASALAILMHQSASFSLAEAWFSIAEDADHRSSPAIGETAGSASSVDDIIYLYKLGANELARARSRAMAGDQAIELALGSFVKPLRRLVFLLDSQGRNIEAEQVSVHVAQEEHFAFARRSPGKRPLRRGGSAGASATELEIPLSRDERSIAPFLQNAVSMATSHRQVIQSEQARIFSGFVLAKGNAIAYPEAWTRSVDAARGATRDLLTAIHKLKDGRTIALNQGREFLLNTRQTLNSRLGLNARVRFSTGAEYVLASVSTTAGQRTIRLTISPGELMNEVTALRNAVRNPTLDFKPSSRKLWDSLLAPLWQREPLMRSGRVHFEVDGALRYIPFAALHDGRSFLAQKVVVTQGDLAFGAPMVGPVVAHTSKVIDAKSLIALGAATHDDSTPSLSHVASEIQSVSSAWQTTGHHAVRQFDDARREDVLRAIADQPTVLHLAAHYRFRPGSETRSSLLLHGEEQLSIAEIRQYSFTGIRLVTLSACDSALDFDDGAEVSGLARALIASGAESVLGSLWAVSDEASAVWMAKFYSDWGGRETKMAKADAIARVQRLFIRTANAKKKKTTAGRSDWSHPYFWAAYVISGRP